MLFPNILLPLLGCLRKKTTLAMIATEDNRIVAIIVSDSEILSIVPVSNAQSLGLSTELGGQAWTPAALLLASYTATFTDIYYVQAL
jgi:hypothetical protein